ncbi:TetR family transcriptional regulator [Serratia fonticola]|jgi:AcrR family transcriptional regulator|uniref:TetR family transcriptional regulator n=1 Tax=Serratia fonticola TaxID=47917 RepID=A0A542D1G9_SERFO|nr:TetR/AcrR family transcriptional regulator [Serratia fonticola]TQI81055.1 TetR family transcriptional regulator [Serratia fonticola]TQI96921.1 TetR family transcriptional regulator [Serratia fonticola]TVZ71416.1 TetR family transcriptional regulator [Serratia fonticola]
MDMTKERKVQPVRGRPKKLDRESVLEKAMSLFWRFGYEPTSMAELIKETGIKPSSLYAEFGSKEGLFCAAVDKYLATYGHARDVILEQDELPLPQVIEQLLRTCVEWFTDTAIPPGCFMVVATFGMSASDEALFHQLSQQRNAAEKKIVQCLEQRARQGELPQNVNCALLGKYIVNVIQGMSVQARNGATRAELSGLVDIFIRQWKAISTA